MGEKLEITSKAYLSLSLGGVSGQASDMEIAANHILHLKKKLYTLLANQCNSDYDKIATACERDYYMDAKEAIRFGIIDSIIGNMNHCK